MSNLVYHALFKDNKWELTVSVAQLHIFIKLQLENLSTISVNILEHLQKFFEFSVFRLLYIHQSIPCATRIHILFYINRKCFHQLFHKNNSICTIYYIYTLLSIMILILICKNWNLRGKEKIHELWKPISVIIRCYKTRYCMNNYTFCP